MTARAGAQAPAAIEARRVKVIGRVQGVGFRPFIYRLAVEHGLAGRVRNLSGVVDIHIEGPAEALNAFVRDIVERAPALARPRVKSVAPAPAENCARFEIAQSAAREAPDIALPPDLFVCGDCLEEMRDPMARRWRYPFINCTQCGPRYTIITGLPYDRPSTTMAGFALCEDCRAEYEDPADRRFHAQPLACPICGPSLSFRSGDVALGDTESALAACVGALQAGRVAAVKGVGGYHLMCDAADAAAVERLRARKHRPDKPLAVMFAMTGLDGLDAARAHLALDPVTAKALMSPERPIVLARKGEGFALAEALAPGLGELGAFLPYSPLHHLLLCDFGGPLVATSANHSGEPVLTAPEDVEARLGQVADVFLHHDRPIARPADDAVVRPVAGVARPIRVGRGLGPLEVALAQVLKVPTLAVGGHMKAAPALGWGARAVLAPHVGELDSPRALDVFEAVIADLPRLYGVAPARFVADAHAGYASHRLVRDRGAGFETVLHHHAHASALAHERPDIARWLVLAWDGVGLGADGTLWGGEALAGAPGAWARVGSWRTFNLPGGERAGREPWRSAAALAWETGRALARPVEGAALAEQAWRSGLNAPETSAVGRLFDAAASMVLGVDRVSFEGQGPMLLEAAARGGAGADHGLEIVLAEDAEGVVRADWAPALDMLADKGLSPCVRAARFHAFLAEAACAQVAALRDKTPFDAVGLTGGVFQNKLLAETLLKALEARGFTAVLPQTAPVNDGGLALGQLVEVAARDALRDGAA